MEKWLIYGTWFTEVPDKWNLLIDPLVTVCHIKNEAVIQERRFWLVDSLEESIKDYIVMNRTFQNTTHRLHNLGTIPTEEPGSEIELYLATETNVCYNLANPNGNMYLEDLKEYENNFVNSMVIQILLQTELLKGGKTC